MKREIITTLDGSITIFLPKWNESYHSKFGAIQEAYHVFIKNGLSLLENQSISILETGFGTGLNAFITFLEAQKRDIKIKYVGVEAYPISAEEVHLLNYVKELNAENNQSVFDLMHQSEWEKEIVINPLFCFTKKQQFINDIKEENTFDLIYFDVFGFRVQPELWSEVIFSIMYKALKPKGILVTYAARGVIKRAMQTAGFDVKKVVGPLGKREMMIAFKNTV